jgi:biopolymer transport protein ExbD
MKKIRHSRLRQKEEVELNITAFMNLMVILVPFLLITAVFTKITVHELNLPKISDAPAPKKNKKEFTLRIVIRDNALIISDQRGLIKRIKNVNGQHNYAALTKKLTEIKDSYPDKTNATVLAEPQTDYDTLIQVMDATRSSAAYGELFPDVSIGRAPK